MGIVNRITEYEKNVMKNMYNNGNSCSEIGEKLNRSESTIRNHLKEMGMFKSSANPLRADEKEFIKKKYLDGARPFEIAQQCNRDSTVIIDYLRRVKLYVETKRKYSKEEIEFMSECYKYGKTEEIFEKFPSITISTLKSMINKLGVQKGGRKKWTKEELEYLKDNYFTNTLEELEEALNYTHTQSAIQTKAFKYYGYSKSIKWTDEENETMQKYYQILPVEEVCKMLPNRSKDAVIAHAKVLGLNSYTYLSTYWTDEETELLLNNWETLSDEELSVLIRRDIRSIKDKRWYLGLKRIGVNPGKYLDIKKYIRGQLWPWKSDSMKNCNYQCVLTGSKEFQVHHIVSFNDICNSVFEDNRIGIKEINEYSLGELDEIAKLVLEKHKEYPLGVCISKELHKLFHKIYGKCGNDQSQWEKFVLDYSSGKYKGLIA